MGGTHILPHERKGKKGKGKERRKGVMGIEKEGEKEEIKFYILNKISQSYCRIRRLSKTSNFEG
jgi:hypothetical protein